MSAEELRDLSDDLKLDIMQGKSWDALKAISSDRALSRRVFDFFLDPGNEVPLGIISEAVTSYCGELTEEDIRFLVFDLFPEDTRSSAERHYHELICSSVLELPNLPGDIVAELFNARHGVFVLRQAIRHKDLPLPIIESTARECRSDPGIRTFYFEEVVFNPSLNLDRSYPLNLILWATAFDLEEDAIEAKAPTQARVLAQELNEKVHPDLIDAFKGSWDGSVGDFITAMGELDRG